MSASTRHFARHYVEMLLAMLLGMGILTPPLGMALRALGTSLHDSDVLMLSTMAVTMTVPMVAWMRYRGHGWQPCLDMTAAMALPALGALGLLWGGLVEDLGVLLVVEHVAMVAAMLAAMLLRRDEYTGGAHRHGAPEQVTA
jgi:hypothetical protein